MADTLHGRDYEQTPKGPRLKPCAPHDVLARLGDKWTILTLLLLSIVPGHRLRFSEIKNGIEGITQRMLTVTLRNLERDGFLIRHCYAEVPPRVEYELTSMGQHLLPALHGFTDWIRQHWPLIVDARRDFDESHQAVDKKSRHGR